MRRVLIIGCCGSGKSTFAKKLNKILKLELIHLDKLYWKPGWQRSSQVEWTKIVQEIIEKDSWIMDGNYDSTLDMRIVKADTVVFFNFPRITCLYNTFKRALRGKLFKVVRSDIKEGCGEKLDWTFLKWIWKFNKEVRLNYLEKLYKLKKEKEIIILHNYKESDDFLEKK